MALLTSVFSIDHFPLNAMASKILASVVWALAILATMAMIDRKALTATLRSLESRKGRSPNSASL